jgi:hypothetical protein
VITTSLPEDFPIGEQTVDRVTVTGYFYRMYTYEARDAGRFAPLLMAQKIEWIPPDQIGANDRSYLWLLLGFCAMFLVALTLMSFWSQQILKVRGHQNEDLPRDFSPPLEVPIDSKLPRNNATRPS